MLHKNYSNRLPFTNEYIIIQYTYLKDEFYPLNMIQKKNAEHLINAVPTINKPHESQAILVSREDNSGFEILNKEWVLSGFWPY